MVFAVVQTKMLIEIFKKDLNVDFLLTFPKFLTFDRFWKICFKKITDAHNTLKDQSEFLGH